MPVLYKQINPSLHAKSRLGFFDLLYPLVADLSRFTTLIHGVRQLDIVKFALPLAKISFHPIFAVVGKHTNFFEAFRVASQPFINLCSPGNSCASKPACLGKSLNIADFPDIPDKLSCLELTDPAHIFVLKFGGVVWCFFGDLDVVWVRFA